MTARRLDLRSDFVARPTPAMVAFAAAAAEREAAFLPWEDPLVRELEAAAAGLFGREGATFAINCSTANFLALRQHEAHCDALVVARQSHLARHEGPLLALLREPGRVRLADDAPASARALLREGKRVLLAIENSDLYACGRALAAGELASLRALKAEAGAALRVHLDGSRIFNAQAAAGYDLAADFAFVDSLSFSLNKGLAAPIGAMLLGEAALVAAANDLALAEARIVRPAHVPAAYALVALRDGIPALAADNRRAAACAQHLRRLAGEAGPAVEYGGTNILFLAWSEAARAAAAAEALARAGILVRPFRDPRTLRLVFHRDIDDAGLARIVDAFGALLAAR